MMDMIESSKFINNDNGGNGRLLSSSSSDWKNDQSLSLNMISDKNIEQQQQQTIHSSHKIQPLFTRSTCSHTILNSPSSTCRLHVVSLNQRQSINNRSKSIEPTSSMIPQMMNQSIDNQLQSNKRTMSMISTLQQNPNNNDQQQATKIISSPTNTITELSSSSFSSPKSPCQISFGCNVISNNDNQINDSTIKCLSYPTTINSTNSYLLQSPTILSKISSTSRTSSIRSRSMQLFFNNGNSRKTFHSQCCSIDWLKFGFKLLLLFTILFWLFSIITWMSIMPKTMPISLTIITSMMTIGLIISLVIQSEWPYSFEFIPNVDDDDDGDTSDDDNDDNDSDDDNRNKHNKRSTKCLINKINGYKNVVQNSNDNNIDNGIMIDEKINQKQINKNNRVESYDSGIGYSDSITIQQQQQKHQQPQEITVIQIDNNNNDHHRH